MKTVIGSIAIYLSCLALGCPGQTNNKTTTTIRFGVMADVHKDIMHDADARLQAFIDTMTIIRPDFIIQLGDFCQPAAKNQEFMNIWDSFKGEKHSVLGNHDMDGGFGRDSTVAFFQSPSRYYSFSKQGFHFIVLDGNDADPSPDRPGGYAHFIGKEQQDWLRNDLIRSKLPTVIFSHQPLNSGITNSKDIMEILAESGGSNPAGRVIACFNGHDHADQVKQIGRIWFIQVNSMSYDWLGDGYVHNSYPDSIHKKYPAIKYTAPYRDPLWALVTLSSDGKISIRGRQSDWVGPSPEELKHPGKGGGIPFSSSITDRELAMNRQPFRVR